MNANESEKDESLVRSGFGSLLSKMFGQIIFVFPSLCDKAVSWNGTELQCENVPLGGDHIHATLLSLYFSMKYKLSSCLMKAMLDNTRHASQIVESQLL